MIGNIHNLGGRSARAAELNILDFGAKGTSHKVTDAAFTNGSAVITSASGGYSDAEEGMIIYAVDQASGALTMSERTIATVTSDNSITVSSALGATLANQTLVYGWDDVLAIREGCAAAHSQGKNLYIPPGKYLISKLPFDMTSAADAFTPEIIGGGSSNTIFFILPSFDLTSTTNSFMTRENNANRTKFSGMCVDGCYEAIAGTDGFYVFDIGQVQFGVGRDLRVINTRFANSAFRVLNGSLYNCQAYLVKFVGIAIANGGSARLYDCFVGGAGYIGIHAVSISGGSNIGSGVLIDGCFSEDNGGPSLYLQNSVGVQVLGSIFASHTGQSAVYVDGTSVLNMTNSVVVPFGAQAAGSGLEVAVGGVAYIGQSRFAKTGAGKEINNAGTIYEVAKCEYTDANCSGTLPIQNFATNTVSGGAIAASGTIPTASQTVRVTAAGAVAGVIMTAGTRDGQICTIIHESVAANTITMAAAATSNVADGTGNVIAGLTAASFRWNSNTSRWYRCK
jgi:hypothetical protein